MITNNSIRTFLGVPSSSRDFVIKAVDSLGIRNNTLMFINKSDICIDFYDDLCEQCVFLVDESFDEVKFRFSSNDIIRVKNPKYLFCLVVEEFRLTSNLQNDFDYISPESKRTQRDYSNSVYCDTCLIGYNCKIDPGVIIGGTDFSPVVGNNPYELTQFPQMGGVKIGDNVVIKYNTMVGKGTFGYTNIGQNSMIDFGCQIGHNCDIGKSCIIAAGTIIGGSTIVGDNTVIGIGAKIRNGIKIGKNVSIGMGSVVIRDVPDNAVVVGNPARIIEHKKIFDEKGLV